MSLLAFHPRVRGETRDPRYAAFGDLARDLLELTREIMRGRVS